MIESDRRRLAGGCHCGNIRIFLATCRSDRELPKRRCSCGFCSRHGAVWTSDTEAELDIEMADPDGVNPYRFGHRTATFHVCRSCGTVPVATCEADGARRAVVNVNTLDGFAWDASEVRDMDYDGEDVAGRTARRSANWIATVTITGG